MSFNVSFNGKPVTGLRKYLFLPMALAILVGGIIALLFTTLLWFPIALLIIGAALLMEVIDA